MLRALRSLTTRSDQLRHACGSLESSTPTLPRAWYSVSNRETQAQMSPLYASRGVLRLAGDDLFEFLQGMITNDVEKLKQDAHPVLYAAILNAQGRQLHDIFLHRDPKDKAVLRGDVDKESLPELVSLLKKHKLRAQVDISDVSDELQVWARFGSGQYPDGDEWPIDPREQKLGYRKIMGENDKPKAEAAFLDPGAAPVETEAEAYKVWRLQKGIAEGNEIPSGEAIPLEYNMDGLNAISFEKGCYIGQELIARTHYKGVVRKRLVPFEMTPESEDLKVGAELTASGEKKPVGKVIAMAERFGVAHVRLAPALAAADAAEGRLQSGDSSIRPFRPDWWPEQWGKEEQQ
ncbi:hypothetical protein WJX74_000189 [Apatococcus lobatus]|uniref:CAF17 C-terminal domain-containing protein n=1 Tax=Apatococcus lobatus TaxID=904363 RepID=A0AAW1RXT4_9CHLO